MYNNSLSRVNYYSKCLLGAIDVMVAEDGEKEVIWEMFHYRTLSRLNFCNQSIFYRISWTLFYIYTGTHPAFICWRGWGWHGEGA